MTPRRRPSHGGGFWFNLLILPLVVLVCFGITWALRQHGIDSCKDRGGTPVVRSWLNESNWDVSCIRLPEDGER